MFASSYSPEILQELSKCVRVMPHHQNTSGFFITVIEKLAEADGYKPCVATSQMEEPADLVIQNDPKKRDFNFFRCDKNDPDV